MSRSEKTFIVKLSLPVASSSPKTSSNSIAHPAYFIFFCSENMDIIREIAILPFPKPDNYHGALSKWVKDGYFLSYLNDYLNDYGIKMLK